MGITGPEHMGLYDSNHAWNIIKLDGEYIIFDLTGHQDMVLEIVLEGNLIINILTQNLKIL